MKVKPVLGDWEIPRIATMESLQQRAFVELPVPGRQGSLFQDMNGSPMRLVISGSLYGDEARDAFLEEVRSRYEAGEPLTFVADVLTATEVQYVIVEALIFQEDAAEPDQTQFYLRLCESPPPPPPLNLLAGLDAGLLDGAAGFLDSLSGVLDALEGLGSIPDISDPTAPLSSALEGITTATSGLSDAITPFQTLLGTPD